ncbi:hypothetical protein SASPL_140560 [Salvia splendens]|uniref:Protein kinase domain-containing protein n=1 Tax=Salvia splendens TaxID=180675 RepID=A0A8X8ZBQ8_SALSN|nr:hypothetical protein SASPL_140560 [Salvia splendens]
MASSTLIFFTVFSFLVAAARSQSGDAAVMQDLKKSIYAPSQLGWTDPDPCKWKSVTCSRDNRVTKIQIRQQNLQGSLPPSLGKLTSLQTLEVQNNQLSGALPSLAGLNSLQTLSVNNNNFTSVPPDFFDGMTSLQEVSMDYNPFTSWKIPAGLKSASALQKFTATSANISGPFPDFFGAATFSSLTNLHLAFNNIEGPLPASLAGSSIQSLWLNGQMVGMNGSISVLQNMTQLTQIWLHRNDFSGPLPDFTGLIQLQDLSLRQNSFTGPVPDSLVGLATLATVNLTSNKLQGKTPKFGGAVKVDMSPGSNSFCLPDPGVECDSRVNALLDVARNFGYPATFADNWKGNDPCVSWKGITCSQKNITVVSFKGMALSGTISPSFAQLTSLQRLVLSNNNLTGTIPTELTTLPNLVELDLSNNQIYGKVPQFKTSVDVKTTGNVNIGKDGPPPPETDGKKNPDGSGSGSGKKSSTGVVVGSVVGGLCILAFAGALVFCLYRGKRKRSGRVQSPHTTVIHPRLSGSDDAVKITIAGSSANGGGGTGETYSHGSSGPSDIHIVEAGNMVISIQVLRNVTDNFCERNILGKGGFGTVYKGELHDGTKIAVKRMESGVISENGLEEFRSEIAVLTKVRHRHLVALLGYCLDGNERLLVFEYMPQGTLSRFLFSWKDEGLQPLEWMKRLTIALDVARGSKKMVGLKCVLPFLFVVTGRVSTKIDVFSFGVILMEIITGRKALDESFPDDRQHLVPWFRRMLINKDTFRKAIDQTIEVTEETLGSICTVGELAGHCSAREPYQRPDMGHVVNVLSSLAELWKPSEPADPDDMYGIDYDMTLPQVLKKWQALEGMSLIDGDATSSSYPGSNDNTQTSIPIRPSGFADSFTSADGR